ncbi:MAG: phosphoribosylformylglycinamidine synthase subunit PurQ [Alphaproteobacteria bacterium]|nr:phosphoribosylformylglycinamidine synthase subunit PurQ [Alphaproteobacteria bacterium]
MRAAVIVYPGSNCDRDVTSVLQDVMGAAPQRVWHNDTTLPPVDIVVLPGGFSYGDYLRCGAMAAHSAIMHAVKAHAERGGYVLGICNGFQVLTETGLLPGVLLPNAGSHFICKDVFLRVEQSHPPFTSEYTAGQVVSIPVAHHDGNYFSPPEQLQALEDNQQIAFRYCNAQGELTADSNPNGSLNNIAGVFNNKRNVLGMMPHPERHADPLTGGTDGRALFSALGALQGEVT